MLILFSASLFRKLKTETLKTERQLQVFIIKLLLFYQIHRSFLFSCQLFKKLTITRFNGLNFYTKFFQYIHFLPYPASQFNGGAFQLLVSARAAPVLRDSGLELS